MLIGFLYELHKNSIEKKNYEGNLLPAETLPNQYYASSKCTRIKVIDFQDFCNQLKKKKELKKKLSFSEQPES